MTSTFDSEIPLTIICLQSTIATCELIAKTSLKSPYLLLVLWSLFCFYFQLIVLNLFPLAVLIWFSFKWKKFNQGTLESSTLYQLLTKCEQKLESIKCLSWENGNAREMFIYFVPAYFIWISLQQVFTLSTLFTLIGSAFIIWESELSSPVRKKYFALKTRITRDDGLWERVNQNDQQQESTFLFEIFENQRFNVFSGQWEDTTFPFERSTWTDSSLRPILSKSQIALPFSWAWIDDCWSATPWSYSTIIWSKHSGNKWYHKKTRRRVWTRTASTKNNDSSRRRSSVYYSQKSTIYEYPSEEKQTDDSSLEEDLKKFKENEVPESDCSSRTSSTPSVTEEKVETIATFPKVTDDEMSCDDKDVSSSSLMNSIENIPRDRSEHTAFLRRSKRLSSTTSSKDAIWKSIVKT